MAQRAAAFAIDGQLLELWSTAQKQFLDSIVDAKRQVKQNAEHEQNPEEWLKGFQEERHNKSKKFLCACSKVAPHINSIQMFVRAAGFSVNIASAAAPVVSPASLVVNAFAWLFDSFAKVSDDYDKIEAFFEMISRRFESLTVIGEHLATTKEVDALHKCIVQLFICCLRFCKLAFEQAKERIKKWLQKLNGSDKLDDELKKLTAADDELRLCIGIGSWKASHDSNETGLRIESQVNKLVEKDNRSEQDEIYEWLSPLEFSRVHRELEDRVSQAIVAGKWLLKSDLFENWRDHNINQIWYKGKPGAGKSVLTSIIINHLKDEVKNLSHSPGEAFVAYLYLSYKSKPNMSELLGSILRQLQQGLDIIPQIRREFEECQKAGKCNGKVQRLSEKEIKSLLSHFTAGRKVYIVIDAMDECEYSIREPLLKHLRSIPGEIKILVTSRDLNHFDSLSEGFNRSMIEAHDDDMEEYIGRMIDGSPVLASVPNLRDEIKAQVKSKSGKMFLIVRFHMAALTDVAVEGEIAAVLKTLPSTIYESYESTMQRISNRSSAKKLRAMSTLGWMAYVQRPLSIHELQHALAISEGPVGIDEKYLRPESEIISDCCGLLIKDLDDIVRYVHYSAQEYFQLKRDTMFPDFDKRITIACAKYLSIQPLQQLGNISGSRSSRLMMSKALQEFPFAEYAGQNLHKHHRRVQNLQNDESILDAIETLVASELSRASYCRLLFKFNAYDTSSTVLDGVKHRQSSKKHLNKLLQPLHVAVFLGSPELVKMLIEDGANVNELDPYQQSSLIVAIKSGLDVVASILIGSGAKIDLSTTKGHAILLYAMERDYMTMVRQVIGNPIEGPLDEGFLRILGLLLLLLITVIKMSASQLFVPNKQPELQIRKRNSGDTSAEETQPIDQSLERYIRFLYLVYIGNVDGLLLLLETSTTEPIQLQLVPKEDESMESKVDDWDTEDSGSEMSDGFDTEDNQSEISEHCSSNSVSDSVLDDNAETSVDLREMEATSMRGWCSYKYEKRGEEIYGDRSISQSEDDEDDAEDDEDDRGDRGDRDDDRDDDEDSESNLYTNNIDLEHTIDEVSNIGSISHGAVDEIAESQDGMASESELTSMPLKIQRSYLRTACFLAIEQSNYEVIKLLLDYGISPDLKNLHGQTLLHRATARSNFKIVELLLDRNATVDLRDENGRTALMANADMKRKRVLKLLIKHGADLNLTHCEGCHELYEAAVYGATEVVRFLLENGADPSVTNHFGWTPLHGAAANGHLACVQLLLDKGAKPSPISDTGKTPKDFVHLGQRHYDHILSGKEHYKAQILKTKELSEDVQRERRDEIMDLLVSRGALTADELYEQIGAHEFKYGEGGMHTHPGWGGKREEDSAW